MISYMNFDNHMGNVGWIKVESENDLKRAAKSPGFETGAGDCLARCLWAGLPDDVPLGWAAVLQGRELGVAFESLGKASE